MGAHGNSREELARQLAWEAYGDSVTAEKLLKTSGGYVSQDYLTEIPVLSYLDEGEQPHYFYHNDSKGITRDAETVGGGTGNNFCSLLVPTNKRILLFSNGNRGESLSYSAITGVEANDGRLKHRLTLFTPQHEYTFYLKNTYDKDELYGSQNYIQDQASHSAPVQGEPDTKPLSNLRQLWDDPINASGDADAALGADPQGAYVTRARFEKVKGILDPDESLHYLTRGSTVDVEGSSAGTSLFGDDRSRKSGTRGYVRAAITDRRVAIKVPQFLGTDERSVPYENITSVDLDTGLVNKRLSLQTPGQTYHIEAHEPRKEEVREIVRFIRSKISEANTPDTVIQESDSEPDPLEQIEKLQELRDAGAISESEFQEKKQDLLDKI